MTGWLAPAMPHLIVVPVLLPLLAAATMLLLGERRRRWLVLLNVTATLAGLGVAIALLAFVDTGAGPGAIGVYLPANWNVPFGIVLAVDHLSAMMLVVTGVVGLGAVLFATARWHRAGVHFHPLFQIQLMGLNGAFLTADLFNLFVFFEVLLTASYGLLLHGSGRKRVRAGLHYIAVNLLASSLFLIGVAMIYGIVGTLNMADIAQKIPAIPVDDRGLLYAGTAILGIAFLVKAAIWPLNFWLVPAYAAASAPVAALFVILTKVGVYAVLRTWTLFLAPQDESAVRFGADALIYGGLVTLALGTLGMAISQNIRRLAAFAIVMSSGTLLAAIGFGNAALTGGALYYLVGSTLAVSALFLLAELIERSRQSEDTEVAIHDDETDHLPFYMEMLEPVAGTNLDDEEEALIGKAIPAAMAFLGLGFIVCALLIAGLPPLAGFLAKFAMLSLLLDSANGGVSPEGAAMPTSAWAFLTLLIASSLLSMISLSRAGIRYFWAPPDRVVPRLRIIECVPVAGLLLACALITVAADPVLRYATAAAEGLMQPARYIEAIMSAMPVPGPTRAGETPSTP